MAKRRRTPLAHSTRCPNCFVRLVVDDRTDLDDAVQAHLTSVCPRWEG